jgi:hypothetical protein
MAINIGTQWNGGRCYGQRWRRWQLRWMVTVMVDDDDKNNDNDNDKDSGSG